MSSSSQNSWSEPGLTPEPVPLPAPLAEDPLWSGLDLLQMIGIIIAAMAIVPLGLIGLAHVTLYRRLPLSEIAKIPELLLIAQILIYAVVFAAMRYLVRSRHGEFWQAIRWNWPRSWSAFLFLGIGLYFVLIAVSQLLPIPKHLPIDRFFETAREAGIMSVIAVTLAPFMEELFFRGFLYPVLARRIGTLLAVLLTSVLFGVLHGAQLGYSWAVLIIFLVGIALTAVRAVTKSVASSFLVHVGYNATLSILLFVATSGFRHLERLNE